MVMDRRPNVRPHRIECQRTNETGEENEEEEEKKDRKTTTTTAPM